MSELHNSYSSPNIIVVIKSRRAECADHVAHMIDKRIQTKFNNEKLERRDHLEDLRVDEG
jgi:hypothetical protein